MARRKKKLQQTDLAREGGLELPNREAMSLIQPGLGIIDMGATGQPGVDPTQPTDGTGGTPTDTGTTPDPTGTGGTDPTGTGTGGLGLDSKATRIIGPLPPVPAQTQ